MGSLFPSHWRNSKKKSPCGPSRPAGTCKGTGAASILPCKKQEPSEMVRIRLTFAAGILTGAKKRPRRGRISGCLRSRWPARSTVCRGRNTSRRSGDFRRGCGAPLTGRSVLGNASVLESSVRSPVRFVEVGQGLSNSLLSEAATEQVETNGEGKVRTSRVF